MFWCIVGVDVRSIEKIVCFGEGEDFGVGWASCAIWTSDDVPEFADAMAKQRFLDISA